MSAVSGSFTHSLELLFIFPSQYFFAINKDAIFSLIGDVPDTLRTIPKVRDSTAPQHDVPFCTALHRAITVYGAQFKCDFNAGQGARMEHLETTTPLAHVYDWIIDLDCSRFTRRY